MKRYFVFNEVDGTVEDFTNFDDLKSHVRDLSEDGGLREDDSEDGGLREDDILIVYGEQCALEIKPATICEVLINGK